MKIPFGAKQYSGEKWVALFAKFLNSFPGRTAGVRALPRSGQSAGRAAVVAPVWKPQLQHTVTWGHWRSTTAKSPSLGGMRKCEHNDFLTDLFYYERKDLRFVLLNNCWQVTTPLHYFSTGTLLTQYWKRRNIFMCFSNLGWYMKWTDFVVSRAAVRS